MTHLCGLDLARALPGWGFQTAPAGLPLSPEALAAGKPAVSLSTYTFGGGVGGWLAGWPDCRHPGGCSWLLCRLRSSGGYRLTACRARRRRPVQRRALATTPLPGSTTRRCPTAGA